MGDRCSQCGHLITSGTACRACGSRVVASGPASGGPARSDRDRVDDLLRELEAEIRASPRPPVEAAQHDDLIDLTERIEIDLREAERSVGDVLPELEPRRRFFRR